MPLEKAASANGHLSAWNVVGYYSTTIEEVSEVC